MPSLAFILAFPSLFNNAAAAQVNIDSAVTVPGTYASPWSVGNDLSIGNTGTGSITASNGAQITDLNAYVGNNSGAQGTVSLSGSGTSWNNSSLAVGNFGSGIVTAQNGVGITTGSIDIAKNAGGIGQFTLSGVGTTLNGSATMRVGSAGNGTLTISAGATGTVSSAFTTVGDALGAVGQMTVTGTGSKYTGQILTVGYAGRGQIDVTSGGALITQGATFGSQSTARGVGNFSGANTLWTTNAAVTVGASGYGELNISQGAALSSNSVLQFATNSGSVGNGTLNAGTVTLNNLIVASHGTSTFTASNGAVINTGGVHVAEGSGGIGSMTVTGAGTLLNDSGYLQIGQGGTGILNLSAGASILSGFVSLGTSANGTLNITGGSTLTGSADVAIGELAAGVGTATVSGSGSTWTNNRDFNIGKAGQGTLTLTDGGSVSTTQNIVIAANSTATGTLNIGAAAGNTAAAPGAIAATTGIGFGSGVGVVNFNHTSTNYVFGNTLSGAGTVNALAGTTVFNNAETYTGTTTIANGATLKLGTGGTVGSIVTGVVDNGTLAFNRSDTPTYAGVVSGTGNLEQDGTGTLTLTGANTYSGQTIVNAGVLKAGNATALSSASTYVMNGGTLNLNNFNLSAAGLAGIGGVVTMGSAALTLNQNSDSSFAGVISGTGRLTKSGSGTLTLSGTNTYSGGTDVEAGTLRAGSATGLLGNASYIVNGGVLDLNGYNLSMASLSGSGGAISLGSATLTSTQSSASTFAGAINGTGQLLKTGTGTLTLSGVNTYTGGTDVEAGILRAGAANGLTQNGAFTVNGSGILNLNNYALSVTNLSGSGRVSLGSATLTIAPTATDSFAGILSGTGQLRKSGSGLLILSGANTFSGGTTVDAGTLQLGSANALLSNTALQVNGGTLHLNDFNFSAASLSGSGGTLDLGTGLLTVAQAGASTYSGAIIGTGGVSKSGLGTLTLAGSNSYSGGTEVHAGTLRAGSANALLQNSVYAVDSGATLDLNGFDLNVGSLLGAGNVALGSATLNVANTGSQTLAVNLSGTGQLHKSGAGLLTLSGTNTYSGDTDLAGGTLRLGSANALSSGSALLIDDGVLDLNSFNVSVAGLRGSGGSVDLGAGSLTVAQSVNGTYSGAIGGAGAFIKSGLGTLTLDGSNSYQGGTEVQAGTLQLGSASAAPQATAYTIASGATLDLHGFDLSVSSLLGAGNVALGNATLNVANTGLQTFAGNLSGTGQLRKSAAGVLTLSGTNTYSGGTVIEAGTLRAGSATALAQNTAYTLSGGNLDLNGHDLTVSSLSGTAGTLNLGTANVALAQNGATTYAGLLTGTGALNKSGSGTFTLTSSGNQIGHLNVAAGSVALASGATLSTTAEQIGIANGDNGQLNLAGAGTLLNNSGTLTIGANGIGTLTLADGASAHSDGAVTLGANGVGNLQITGGAVLNNSAAATLGAQANGSGSATVSGSGSQWNSSGNLTVGASGNGNLTISDGAAVSAQNVVIGANSGSSGVINIGAAAGSAAQVAGSLSTVGGIAFGAGSGTLNFNQTSSSYVFSNAISGVGTVNVIAGTTIFDQNETYTGATNISSGATLQLGNGGTGGSIASDVVNDGTLAFNHSGDFTYLGVISGSGNISQAGLGTLTLSGANTYSGGTQIDAGTIKANAAGSLAGDTNYVVNGGTLDLNGYDLRVANLRGAGGTVALGGAILEVRQSTDSTFAGAITQTGQLIKSGVGTLTLTGANTYSGGTEVDAGILQAGSATALSANTHYTINGGTLDLNGYALTASSLSGSGGTLALGSALLTVAQNTDTTYSGTVTGSGGLRKTGSGSLTLSGTNSYSGGTDVEAGTLRAGSAGALLANSNYTVNGGTLDLNGFDLQVASLAGAGGSLNLGSAALSVNQAVDTTFAGNLVGTGSLAKTGNGTLTLSGSNIYSGGTQVDGGVLLAGNAGAFVSDTSYTVNGGTLALNGYDLRVASLTGSGGTVDLGSAQLNVANTGANTFSGSLAGSGRLIKTGAGTLTLDGSNTYSGGTEVDAGVLLAGSATALVGGTAYTVNGGTLDLQGHALSVSSLNGSGGTLALGNAGQLLVAQNSDQTFAGAITGAGQLIKTGSGTLTVTGSNTYSGGTEVDAGILRAGSANALVGGTAYTVNGGTLDLQGHALSVSSLTGSGGTLALGTGGQLTVAQTSDQVFAGAIIGAGQLNKTGSGMLLLTGSNAYTGGTLIDGGALVAGSAGAFVNDTAYTVNGGTLALNGHDLRVVSLTGAGGIVDLSGAQLNVANTDVSTYSGSLAGTGRLIKSASGTLTLDGSNTYSGGTEVDGGVLRAGSAGALLDGTAVTVNGGTLDLQGHALSVSSLNGNGGTLALGNAGQLTVAQNSDQTFGGAITGAGQLSKTGNGALTLTGNNTYSGGTLLSAGSLVLGAPSAMAAGMAYTVNGGTFDLHGNNLDMGSLNGSGGTISLGSNGVGASTLSIGSSTDSSFSGMLSGTGGLVKNGSGTLTLTGASSYSGGTSVNAGTLAITNSLALGTGAVTVNSGAQLDLVNNGLSLTNNITVNGTATVNVDQGGVAARGDLVGAIVGNGQLIKTGAGVLNLGGASSFSGGVALLDGALGIMNDLALGTGTLNMQEGTQLNFSRAGMTTLSNRIILTGDPTFDVATGSTVTVSGDIVDGTLAGDLVKTGNGTLVLTGNDSFTGGASVAAGLLMVNGQLASAVQVNSGAALGGTGQVGSLNVANGGMLYGGAAGSGLTVNGDLNLAAGAVYALRLGAGGATGLTSVNGNLTLAQGALLKLIGAPDTSNPLGTHYTIFRYSGSQTGAFDLDSSYIYVAPNVLYDNGAVTLNFAASQHLQQHGFSLSGNTGNEVAVANALTAIYLNGGNRLIDTLLLTTEAQARAGLTAMANNPATDNRQMAVRRTEQAEAGIAAHLASNEHDGVWLQNTRQDGRFGGNSSAGASAYSDAENTLTLGVDGHVTPEWRAGVAVTATDSHASYDAMPGKNASNGALFSLYGGYRPDTSVLYVNGIASVGAWHNTISRDVGLAALSANPHGSFRTSAANVYAETGLKLKIDEHVLNPYLALDVGNYRQAAFGENSRNDTQDFDLRYHRANKVATSANVGLRTEHQTQLAGYPLTLQADAAWRHRFGDDTDTLTAAFASAPNTPFKLTGARLDRNELRTRLGAKWDLPGDVSLNVNVGSDVLENKNYQTEVGVSWRW